MSTRVQHRMSRGKLYKVWTMMKQRCSNPSACGYHRYGGRGIKVCKSWQHSFMEFHSWAIASGYRAGLQIDRIDNDGNYHPSNCRWVSNSVNNAVGRHGLRSNNSSGIVGVGWFKPHGRWQARIYVGGKNITLGYFDNLDDAASARIAAELQYFGEDLTSTHVDKAKQLQADVAHKCIRKTISSANKSGYVGVIWYAPNKRWMVYGTVKGKRKHLGYFVNLADAVAARRKHEAENTKE